MQQGTSIFQSQKGLLSTAQAAEILSVHPNTIRNWADAGLLSAYRIGPRRDRRFLRADIDEFLKTDRYADAAL